MRRRRSSSTRSTADRRRPTRWSPVRAAALRRSTRSRRSAYARGADRRTNAKGTSRSGAERRWHDVHPARAGELASRDEALAERCSDAFSFARRRRHDCRDDRRNRSLPSAAIRHATRIAGKSARNATLFGPPHRAYVYQIYGTSYLLQFVERARREGAGVLVRALEPVEGSRDDAGAPARRAIARLCRGPGRLCRALGHRSILDGLDLFDAPRALAGARRRRSPAFAAAAGSASRVRRTRRLRFYARRQSLRERAGSLEPSLKLTGRCVIVWRRAAVI